VTAKPTATPKTNLSASQRVSVRGRRDLTGSTTSSVPRMKELRAQIKACEKCEGMNIHGVTQAAPGYGSVHSPVVLVGQSLCHECMESQIPFTGGSGELIDASLALAGVDKRDIFITNVVHCHPHSEPRDNRASKPHEIANCTPYLVRELNIVEPELITGFGQTLHLPPRRTANCTN